MEQLVVSANQARKMLAIQPNRMYEMLEHGELPAYREGRGWKIPVSELERYVIERAKREAEERRNEKKVQMES